MSENKKRFLVHGGILAVAGILVRIIGMFYRIPLVNIIGGEGNGIYSVAYNIYNIMLVLSAYGMPMAVSKLISARFAKRQYKNANQIFRCSMIFAVISGGIAALLLYFGADFIESAYKSVHGLAIPLRILAPTIFFVAVMGVMRGFFQGQGTMIPTAVSQLVEQVVNAVVSVAAAYALVKMYKSTAEEAAYGAAGGTLGTCFGAVAGFLFLVVIYIIYKPAFSRMIKGDKARSEKLETGYVYKVIGLTMLPIILSQTLYHICSVVDDMMYSNIMAGVLTPEVIKTNLGTYSTCYVLLVGIPQGIASAMSSSMLPSVVASYTNNDMKSVKSKIASTIKTNMIIAIPSFVGLFVLGQPIIKLLFSSYDSVQGSMMLKLGAISVVFYTLSTVTSSALQGIDKMSVPVKNAGISVAVHVVLAFILLKFTRLDIYAVVIGNATFPVLTFILNMVSLKKYVGYRQEYINTFCVPALCAVIMGIATYFMYKFVYFISANNFISVMLALLVAVLAYFGPLYIISKNTKRFL